MIDSEVHPTCDKPNPLWKSDTDFDCRLPAGHGGVLHMSNADFIWCEVCGPLSYRDHSARHRFDCTADDTTPVPRRLRLL